MGWTDQKTIEQGETEKETLERKRESERTGIYDSTKVDIADTFADTLRTFRSDEKSISIGIRVSNFLYRDLLREYLTGEFTADTVFPHEVIGDLELGLMAMVGTSIMETGIPSEEHVENVFNMYAERMNLIIQTAKNDALKGVKRVREEMEKENKDD